MPEDKDIIATAPADAPEVLDGEALDNAVAGAQYGGTNTCEPVRPRMSELFIKSWSTSGASGEANSFKSD